MTTPAHYDYIILGTGLSGLMLAYRLSQDIYFKDKKILLLDKAQKTKNDRTWCFWKEGKSEWGPIISKKWHTIAVKGKDYEDTINLENYSYNKIEAIDFYSYCLSELEKVSNITIREEKVIDFSEREDAVTVTTETADYTAQKVFTSILPVERLEEQKHSQVLQQHFIGWDIEAENPVFDPDLATFMDFTVAQKGNTRFMYVLPVSNTRALVEYTLFSEKLLPDAEYEIAIKEFITELGITNYTIKATEKGSIPMTSYPFERHNTKNIMHIGTAGGFTRGSTGFTFNYTDKITIRLVDFLKKDKDFRLFKMKNRFRWYDRLFLDVLYRKNEMGSQIFTTMFKMNKIQNIFRFLDGESTPAEEVKLISTLPKKQFLIALFKEGSKG
tara:strand:+ start:203039 stop:204193 length:1155 start_codon:yes stop_codon:yes gene_type:complete